MDDLNALVNPVIGVVVVAARARLRRAPRPRHRAAAARPRRSSAGSRASPAASPGRASRTSSTRISTRSTRSPARWTSWRRGRRCSRRPSAAPFQRIGLVRFNPFEDTGGNQSFALALLDQAGDGFVVSSLHARAGTRVYGKAVAKGPPNRTSPRRRARPCASRSPWAFRRRPASDDGGRDTRAGTARWHRRRVPPPIAPHVHHPPPAAHPTRRRRRERAA